MRAVGIFFVSALCTRVHGYDSQQLLGSVDLSGSSYKCESGVKPSLACVDPALNKDTCSCTCTNGIKFDQPLDPFSSVANRGSGPGLENNSACQADKDLLMTQIKDLTDDQQKHLNRQQALLDQISTYQNTYNYQGCFTDAVDHVLNAFPEIVDKNLTVESCQAKCEGYKHFGVNNGINCMCGDKFANPTKQVAETDCNVPCGGNNKQQKCGGRSRLSVYSKPFKNSV
ncbi:unnamed protein product [Alternaria alternata]